MIDESQPGRVQTAMNAVARAHGIPIALIKGEREGEHLGTGTVVQLRSKPYLLTCDHIVRERTRGSLAIGLGSGKSPIGVTNPIQTGDSKNDVALSRLNVESLEGGSIIPLQSSRLSIASKIGSDDL